MQSFFVTITVGLMLMNSMQAGSSNAVAQFPSLTSKDLAGNSVDLPAGFPAERTILLVAFEREQQHDIDSWVEGLHLGEGKLPWLELPVIDNPGAIGRWFIDNGMRRGIKDHQVWAHVVTLYTKKAEFKSAMQIGSEKEIEVFVADRSGKVFERQVGPYSQDTGNRILAALRLGQ